ncbi:GHKL domain-containing protein, partial [Alkalibaculum bacchi]|uniref:GHKL domain-containing protein n=1 Tax=Alkalibaculum bacchi TaxID=645887 RepID=UPI0026F23A4D
MELINYVFEYILYLSDFALFYFFIRFVHIKKKSYSLPLMILFIVGASFFVFAIGVHHVSIYLKIPITFLLCFLLTRAYDCNSIYGFLMTLLFHMAIFLSEFILICLIYFATKTHPNELIFLAEGARYIFSFYAVAIKFLFLFFLTKIFRAHQLLLPKIHTFILSMVYLLIIIISAFLIQILLYVDTNGELVSIFYYTSVCFIILTLAITYFYLNTNLFFLQNERQKIKEMYNKSNEQYLSHSKEQHEYINKVWHDIDNHIKNWELLIKENNSKNAFEYLQSLKNKMSQTPNAISTGNHVADIVLNRKYINTMGHHIDFQVKGLLPEKLSIEDLDISSFLFNSIDNAIEANLQMSEEDRFIHIELYPQKQYLYYQIKNPVPIVSSGTNKKIFARKKHISPGYGLLILQDLADKYQGNLDYQIVDHQFILTLHLLLNVSVKYSPHRTSTRTMR